MTTAIDVVHAFNDAINARDLATMTALMTEDHRFVDSEGSTVDGKVACTEAWRRFFAAFPDYRNVFDDASTSVTAPDVVDVVGRSECAYAALNGPARWRAVVRDDKVSVWQVFSAPT